MTALAGLFSFVPGWIWAALLAGSVLHGCWLGNRRDSAVNDLHGLQTQVAKADAQRAEQARAAEAAARTEESRRNEATRKVVEDAQAETLAARADAVRADAAAQRLRKRTAELEHAANSCAAGHPAPVGASASAGQAADLLAYVRRRLDEAEGRTIEFADAASTAGTACERQYDALTKN